MSADSKKMIELLESINDVIIDIHNVIRMKDINNLGSESELPSATEFMKGYIPAPDIVTNKTHPKILLIHPKALIYNDIIGITSKIDLFDRISEECLIDFEKALLYKTVMLSNDETDINKQYTFLFTTGTSSVPNNPRMIMLDVIYVPNGLKNLRYDDRYHNLIYTVPVFKTAWEEYNKDVDYVVLNTRPCLYRERS